MHTYKSNKREFSKCTKYYNLGYVNSVDEVHKLIAEFETGLTIYRYRYCAFSLVYLVQVLWHGLDDTTIVESFGLT